MSTFDVKNNKVLNVEPEGLTLLAEQAMFDVAHLLRPSHLQVGISYIIKLHNKHTTDFFFFFFFRQVLVEHTQRS